MTQASPRLQRYLEAKFSSWRPPAAEPAGQTQRSVTLQWAGLAPFGFLRGLLYTVRAKTKVPPWTTVYSGGKTSAVIDNLAPSFPHKFTLQVILRSEAAPALATMFLQQFGSEENVYKYFGDLVEEDEGPAVENVKADVDEKEDNGSSLKPQEKKAGWLTSQVSAETCVTTLTRGTTPACFCMAVRCGYLKQVQQMLEENPLLLETVNSANGQTPLITAVTKGDMNTVSFLLSAGASPQQASPAGHSALQLALYQARLPLAELLLDQGASIETRDLNGCRAEHYAADSGSVEVVKFVMDRGGDVTVTDSNGWTPLFRAICQGASSELIEELVRRGSDVSVRDAAGLPLPHAARLLTDRRGQPRNSVVRQVDPSYPRELAVTHFTRLTRKISSMHAVFK